ncbi:MAG TPA: ThiF family adenylyltransferase [Candidatus Saccharimonadales bacterium]|nr:ThiF family adenylyltransferase [Candidatus Saccharimonadales bacterium]
MGYQVAPRIFEEGGFGQEQLEELKVSGYELADTYKEQLEELFEIDNPGTKDEAVKREFLNSRLGGTPELKGNWVIYDWQKKAVHLVGRDEFHRLRTNRNREIVTLEELETMSKYTVGIAGMSVGNSIARALNSSSVCGGLVIADHDRFSLSNMNRVNISVADLGETKVDVTLRQLYENNPYARVKVLPQGLDKNNLDSFFASGKFIAIDEIDDFEMKVRIRQAAKQKRVPVVMLTNLGDNTLIDVERYDSEDGVRPFNSLADDTVEDILAGKMSPEDMKRYAANLAGIQNVPTRALKSLTLMGRSLVGRPQLYSSVAISGGLAAYVVKQIILGKDVKSGRYKLSLGEVLGLGAQDVADSPERQEIMGALGAGK